MDIHSGLSFSDKRAETFDFSSQIYKTYTQIYYRLDDKQPETIKGYDDSVVGIQYGTYMDTEFRKAYPEIRVRNYSTGQDLIRALLDGEVKAAVHETLLMNSALDRMGLGGNVAVRQEKLFPSTIHSAVRKGDSDLLQDINEGFAAIGSDRLVELEKRWISDPASRYFAPDSVGPVIGRLVLTEEEKQFLRDNPGIVLGSLDLAPYSFRDANGNLVGLIYDYLELVNRIIG